MSWCFVDVVELKPPPSAACWVKEASAHKLCAYLILKSMPFQISSYFNSYIIYFLKSFLKKWFTARTDTVVWFLVLIPDPYNLYPRHQIFDHTAYHCPQNRWGSASAIRTGFLVEFAGCSQIPMTGFQSVRFVRRESETVRQHRQFAVCHIHQQASPEFCKSRKYLESPARHRSRLQRRQFLKMITND